MEFLNMIERLQLICEPKILLISCGSFYIAVARDAIALNKELGLKVSCARRGLCKVGIPKNSIAKYIKLINEKGYGYTILNYIKEEKRIIKIYEYQGVRRNFEYASCKDCKKCENRKFFKKTEYEQALEQYLIKEGMEEWL